MATSNTGAMRQAISIVARATTQEGTGELTATWSPVVTNRRAQVTQTPGRELFTGQERAAFVPTVIRIRHPRADFTVLPQMRVVFDGRLFDIKSVSDPDGLKVDLVLTCEERVNEPTS